MCQRLPSSSLHSTDPLPWYGVPQGDPGSILEGKSVVTLMRPKKNALRSSQIHNILRGGYFRLISSVRQSIQVISRECFVLETYSVLSRHQSCAVSFLLHALTKPNETHLAIFPPIWLLPPLHLLRSSWGRSMVINSLLVSWLVLVNKTSFASTRPHKIFICFGFF